MRWQILRMLSYAVVALPNGKSWLVPYSRLVISSITGPVEKIFRHIEVAPSSVDRMGRCAGKMATLQQFWSKFPPLSMFLSLGPTSLMVGMPASGLSWGICCQQPRQMIRSTSFDPSEAAWQNILCNITRWCGLSLAQLLCISRNRSTSMALFNLHTSLCSTADLHLASWNFSRLLRYFTTINLW